MVQRFNFYNLLLDVTNTKKFKKNLDKQISYAV